MIHFIHIHRKMGMVQCTMYLSGDIAWLNHYLNALSSVPEHFNLETRCSLEEF